MRTNFVLKKFNADAVVTANVKTIYQQASMTPAIDTKYMLNIISLFTDINCE